MNVVFYSTSGDESLKVFTSDVREQLLHGLADDADDIRYVYFIYHI